MLKPKSLYLTVDTPQRTYKVSWFSGSATKACGGLETSDELTVHVETTTVDGCLFTENFTIPAFETETKITGTKDLQTWFYGDFAYQYADIHKNDEESGCVRAAILYDLGNYKIAKRSGSNRDETIIRIPKQAYYDFCDADDKSKIFYVCMNDGSSAVYCFSSYDSAEQWANEKLYQNESIDVSCDNLPYTIFTVEDGKQKNEEDNDPLDLPCSESKENIFDKDNAWVEKNKKGIIYHLTADNLYEIISNIKKEGK